MDEHTDVEILVHVNAPAKASDDAKYRALAAAYLNFKPAKTTDFGARRDLVDQSDQSTEIEPGQTEDETEYSLVHLSSAFGIQVFRQPHISAVRPPDDQSEDGVDWERVYTCTAGRSHTESEYWQLKVPSAFDSNLLEQPYASSQTRSRPNSNPNSETQYSSFQIPTLLDNRALRRLSEFSTRESAGGSQRNFLSQSQKPTSTPNQLLESWALSFESVDHNLYSPVAKRTVHLEAEAGTQTTEGSWRPPPSVVGDSCPNNNQALPQLSSPTRLLEHFIEISGLDLSTQTTTADSTEANSVNAAVFISRSPPIAKKRPALDDTSTLQDDVVFSSLPSVVTGSRLWHGKKPRLAEGRGVPVTVTAFTRSVSDASPRQEDLENSGLLLVDETTVSSFQSPSEDASQRLEPEEHGPDANVYENDDEIETHCSHPTADPSCQQKQIIDSIVQRRAKHTFISVPKASNPVDQTQQTLSPATFAQLFRTVACPARTKTQLSAEELKQRKRTVRDQKSPDGHTVFSPSPPVSLMDIPILPTPPPTMPFFRPPQSSRRHSPPTHLDGDFPRSLANRLNILSPMMSKFEIDDRMWNKFKPVDMLPSTTTNHANPLRALSRGYWLVNTSSWTPYQRYRMWGFLSNWVGGRCGGCWMMVTKEPVSHPRGEDEKARKQRDSSFGWLRLYTFACVARHGYSVLKYASERLTRRQRLEWIVGGSGGVGFAVPAKDPG